MNVIRTRNVHHALPLALELMRMSGAERASRNGPVLISPTPVTTVYDKPLERVLFWPERDANPFFHFYEAMWMLAGRDDVPSMTHFVKDFDKYSDDGHTFHGTYGPRWRRLGHWTSAPRIDQLETAAVALAGNADDRRQVVQMWDGRRDAPQAASGGKDVPCNLTATLQTDLDGAVCLVVFCRSNDVVLGCYGANAVQFSYLLEYVARRAKRPIGTYSQISVNWHGYRSTFDPLVDRMAPIVEKIYAPCPYERGEVEPYPLMSEDTRVEDWENSLQRLTSRSGRTPAEGRWQDPFFPDVALPLMRAHDAFRDGVGEARYTRALRELETCRATDWRRAAQEWISRRHARFVAKGVE